MPADNHDHTKIEPVYIGSLVQKAFQVPPYMRISRAKDLIHGDRPIQALIIVKGKAPKGLLMSIHLDRILSYRYGFSLFQNKPVRKIMDRNPLILEADILLAAAADLAMDRPIDKLYDHLIVTKQGKLMGTVSVQNILQKLNKLQRKRTTKLEKALQDVETLRGLIPICSHCKKIRDDSGYWNQLEAYISKYSKARFSHGICPECVAVHYPDFSKN